MLGPDHPDTLRTRHDIALWRREAGDRAGAVAAAQELLADRVRVLGPNHPDTLWTRHLIANWRADAGAARDSRAIPSRRCGRCGRAAEDGQAARLPQDGDADENARKVSLMLLHPWVSTNGTDVCPQCQTTVERKDAAGRVVSANESEITRSSAIDTSFVEPGLVAFAMQLREALLREDS